ncbi:GNAT family N-acetyltransferase [Cardiobacteriaceae bacterium TAE3-ERU3]|nr:GNAT family N-acetyltransferase [Cardiobacteriaceae bacterium TAE3-ERU3]
MYLEEITLQNEHVILSPLRHKHANALLDAASDGQLWNIWYTSVPSRETIATYINHALTTQQHGTALPFVVIDKRNGQIVGTTRFYDFDDKSQRLLLGYTWYAQSVQRSAVNTSCKLLLLQHAFETLQCVAVEFRTHWINQRSRNAIARLGAKQDGILRRHMKMPDGSYRDTVVFSILDNECQP